MPKITFCGDVHGKIDNYNEITNSTLNKTVQLGDFGFGFLPDYNFRLNKKDFFIRGNHDNPYVAKSNKYRENYLGDFGFSKELNLFFVSGAYSIDKDSRIDGYNWWEEEEINPRLYDDVMKQYLKSKPKVLISHACPEDQMIELFGNKVRKVNSKTGNLLSRLVEAYRPKVVIFGHMHISVDKEIDGVRYICLNELETIEINTDLI